MSDREELEALRRLAELEAKAGGGAAPSSALIPQFVEGGKDLARGAMKTVQGQFQTASQLPGFPGMVGTMMQLAAPQTRTNVAEKLLPTPKGDSPGREYGRAFLEGTGGALVNPFGGTGPRALISTGLSGGNAGVAAKAAGDALEGQNPVVKKIGEILAAVAGGGITAWATGPKDSRPTNVKAEEDSKILRDLALERIGPETDPLAVANQTSAAANRHIRGLEQQNSNNFSSLIQGVQVPGHQVAAVYRQLRAMAAAAPRAEEAAALTEVANRLVDQTGTRFITDLPELSLSIKGLKENPPGPNASTGRTIGSHDLSTAVTTAENLLGQVAPEFLAANQVYRQGQRVVLDPTREGPIGRIADRNPQTAAPTPVGRLENITRDRDAAGINTTLQQLEQSGAPVRDIARTLVGRSVNAGPVRPGKSAMGAPGSGQEAQVSALLESAGVDPTRVQGPLRAADALADSLEVPTNVTEYVSVHPKGVSLRGILRPDRWFGGPSNAAEYKRQIAELLSRANPQEMDQLYRLSMFDPKVRSLITAAAAAPQIYKEGEK